MTWQSGIYLASILSTFIVYGFLAGWAWSRRKNQGNYYFFWLSVNICILALLEALSVLSPTQAQALFWYKLRFFPIASMAPICFLFVLEYCGYRVWISRGVVIGLYTIPFLTQLFIWLPALSPLWVTRDVSFLHLGIFWVVDITTRIPEIWFYVHSITSGLMLFGAAVLLIYSTWHYQRTLLKTSLLIIVSALIPAATAIINLINLTPDGWYSSILPAFSLAGIIIAVALLRFDFLSKPPELTIKPLRAIENKERKSLIYFISLFFLITTFIIVFGVVSFQKFSDNYYSQIENQLISINDLKIRGLLSWRAERIEYAQMVQQSSFISQALQSYFHNPNDAQNYAQIQGWFDNLVSNYQYNRVFFLDTQGVERISSPKSSEPVDADLIIAEQQTLQLEKVDFIDFYKDPAYNAIFLALEVPIYANNDPSRPLGVVVLRIDPYTYLYPYLQQWPVQSYSAETLLIRKEGNSVLSLSPLRFQPDAALNLQYPLTETNLLVVKALQGSSGITEGVDYRNQPVIGAFASVGGDTSWYIVAHMDLSEVNQPLNERALEYYVFFGTLLLAIGSTLLIIWRQRFLPYYQKQTQLAEDLSENQALLHQSLKAAKAGVWQWVLQTGENTWSEEVWDLYGLEPYSCKPSYENWLATVIPEDRQKISQEIADGIKEGRELINEWRVKDRNGQIRWLFTRGSPIKDSHGQAIRYIGTAFDITERKLIEEALIESEDKFRYMFDYSVIGKSITLLNGEMHVNQAFADMLGYTREELEAKNWREISYPEDIALNEKYLDEVENGGAFSRRFEKRYLHKNGSIVWTDITLILRRDQQGHPLYYLNTISDITAAKKAIERQNFLYSALNATINEIYIFDAETLKFEFASSGALANLGYSMEELKQMTPLDIKPNFTQESFGKLLKLLREGDQVILHFETIQRRKDGSFYPVEVHIQAFEQEGHQVFLAVILDITQRQQAELALMKSEEKFFTLFDKAPFTALLSEYPSGKIVDVNQAFENQFGYKKEEVIGLQAMESGIIADAPFTSIQSQVIQVLNDKGFWHDQDLTIRTKSGEERIMLVNLDLIEMSSEKFILLTSQDITERKQAEKQLHLLTEELQRSNTELEQFAYVASHDLQEPLRMVSSYLQLIERRYKGQLDQNADDFIHYAVDGAFRMQNLINDLLTYSRVGTRGKPLENVSANEVLQIALENLQVTIQEHQAHIDSDPLPVVFADKGQLIQVFQNLIGNAIKFHSDALPQVHISAEENAHEWIFSVKDNGIGIEPQYAERIFIIFQRLQSREKYEGTGIGLAVCKKIIQRHGGRIWVESTVGNGATFFFTLPKQE